ncbi:sacsin N-terminal ATP-binding-like domain-containing protein [Dyadobacter sp. CY356]|uniref:sacsin N-terminal ATP-binding-like domain-containing protein n=1 Tax=Dyadobacter sp. CY356 TaxID=2906442 RepID=UPI001F462EF0|nr:hypothetical protein [Dyadobacter sp. CY356]MCF0055343.1 hypothetical protein [Dyadobacter sp. CY356]
MTYRDKFSASEHKAHYQNIATKVLREMTALRASVDTSPNTPRRWVWELLQNAKDVHRGEGVKIKISEIEKDGKDYLAFQHDGLPFTADNIRFLIEQISSKDREKKEDGRRKETGKFGTGFLTTHMLSEKVKVVGVAKEEGLDYRKFSFTLDRSGFELHEIIAAVEKSKSQIVDIDGLKPYLDYKEAEFNTKFVYLLEDNLSRQVKNQGIADLHVNLPYALCFVNEINSVILENRSISYQVLNEDIIDKSLHLKVVAVKIANSGQVPQNLNFAILSSGLTSIAIPIERKKDSTTINPIVPNVPRIFCDFPLIGTESFPFPAIINNPNFNLTDPRDGIFLTDSTRANRLTDENKQILEDAVKLYFDLLDHAIENDWKNLHLLAKLGYLREPVKSNTSVEWYERMIQKPLRKKLARSKIVRNANGKLCSVLNDQDKECIWFPSGGTKEIREITWDLANLWFPYALPQKEHVEYWTHTIWSECGKLTLLKFSEFVEHYKTLSNFVGPLKNTDPIEWLNLFYDLLSKDEKEFVAIMEAKAIVPDQNGNFVKKSQLSKQIDKIPELFKDILKLFGTDIRSKLVNDEITIHFEDHDYYSLSDAVKTINAEVLEKTNDREVAQNFRPALNLLIRYFSDNPSSAKAHFPGIYSKKHLLYDDEEIMDNINRAEELKDLLSIFEVSSADELRKKFETLSSDKPSLLPVTEEILIAMGITNIEEWDDAMRDTDLQSLFDHRSVPTKDMFVLSHSHIDRARKRVIQHLRKLVDDYNLDELDVNTAPTILAGISKHERPVKIVFRPAYSKEVIVYYGAEKDTLDYADAELWVDDGTEVWQVSLGHILKKNNIKKFPI